MCAGISPVTGEVLPKRASNEENVSIWWRLHAQFRTTFSRSRIVIFGCILDNRPSHNTRVSLVDCLWKGNLGHWEDHIRHGIIDHLLLRWLAYRFQNTMMTSSHGNDFCITGSFWVFKDGVRLQTSRTAEPWLFFLVSLSKLLTQIGGIIDD